MQTIGRKDKADFPELNLHNIDVKVDTGAYTSSIHCHHIEVVIVRGQKCLRFKLLDPNHPKYNNKSFLIKEFRQKIVKNSFGSSERRFVIKTAIVLFGSKTITEFTLSERGEMKYPVLLGRKLLNKRFVVDTSKFNLSFKQKKLTDSESL